MITVNGCTPWEKVATANDASASFTAPAMTLTPPTANVIELAEGTGPGGSVVPQYVQLVFIGAGADNTTFTARVIGWELIGTTWMPVVLTQLAVTLGAMTGIADGALTATDRIADTITLDTPFSGMPASECTIVSPAADLVAKAIVATRGMRLIQLTYDMTGATSGNAIWKPV